MKILTTQNLLKGPENYWSQRIVAQLNYIIALNNYENSNLNSKIERVILFLEDSLKNESVITMASVLKAEEMLLHLKDRAKKYKVLCAAHAHIDMNWQWGYEETVAVTLETFRTVLKLMNEYPDFKFSQSQASVYRIVELHEPDMLEDIRSRIKEGRWEVTASTWVETDKNMPSGESLARHFLMTRNYLIKLLDLEEDDFNIDFEPDTFGHNINVPEINNEAGVKFYYHGRGFKDEFAYRWKSPSGAEILNYREPHWYNPQITYSFVEQLFLVAGKTGIDTILRVYGAGDHGGGPTRRDVERISDMASWPLFPDIKYGTFIEYFRELDKVKDQLPLVDRELNFIFTGCFTSQSRIKTANRIGEGRIHDAELMASLASLKTARSYPENAFDLAWENILFNHFHDILPGSGSIETREHALGKFQETLATVNTEITGAFRKLMEDVNTASFVKEKGFVIDKDEIKEDVSEGAGVGFSIKDYSVPQAERGQGKNRVIHLFNPSPIDREEVAEIVIWDWPVDFNRIQIMDSEGNEVPYQHLKEKYRGRDSDIGFFWAHTYIRLLIPVKVPSLGYSTYFLRENPLPYSPPFTTPDPRINLYVDYTLENEHIVAKFDENNMSLKSLVDKKTGMELMDPSKASGVFRLVYEDVIKRRTSWEIGRYMKINNLNLEENAIITKHYIKKDAIRQWFSYYIEFMDSRLEVEISLDRGSRKLNYKLKCDWQEKPSRGEYVPQLQFYLPLGYNCENYRYDIPFGVIEREGIEDDVPGNSFAVAIPNAETSALGIISKTKYGFRGIDDSLTLNLIRSSYDPDPYPELGVHNIEFALSVTASEIEKNKSDRAIFSNKELIQEAFDYNHPVYYMSGTIKEGRDALKYSFMSIEEGSINLSTIKRSVITKDRKTKALLLRAYEVEGEKTKAIIKFDKPIKIAYLTDIHERKIYDQDVEISKNSISFELEAYKLCTLYVEF